MASLRLVQSRPHPERVLIRGRKLLRDLDDATAGVKAVLDGHYNNRERDYLLWLLDGHTAKLQAGITALRDAVEDE